MLDETINYRQPVPRLAASGQPDEAELAALAQAGYEVVINIALHDDPRYSLADHGAGARRQETPYDRAVIPVRTLLLCLSLAPALPMAAVLAMPAPLHAATLVERARKDEPAAMPDEDPAMRKAFDAARAGLDGFLAKLASPPAGSGSFAVKVGIRSGSDLEYVWIGNLSIDGERLSGRLDNEPRKVKALKAGDVHAFTKADIVDWLYVDRPRRRMHGNFTACALMTREPPKEAAALRRQLGLTCSS